MDAVPFLIERKGAGVEHVKDYELLHQLRDFLQWRRRDAVLLAEANVPPEESLHYFGDKGDRLQMMLNFPVNQRLFYALATADLAPLCEALEETRCRPGAAQWVQFLRSHDELDLGRLTARQRQRVFDAFGPEQHMQLYNRGIRRRLAPMLGNDRRRLELAFSLLFALPGTPMLQYGDEIGMGDNLELPEREAARTPMQWTAERHGGFSRAAEVVRPVIADEVFGYRRVNVADQRRDPDSLLNWQERMIRMRRECPEIGWGDYEILAAGAEAVLALRYDWRNASLLTLHNFSGERQTACVKADGFDPGVLVNTLEHETLRADQGAFHVPLEPYGYKWYRVGAPDASLDRTAF
jgi:maltose alpha-D-glucosyltransferase/alpha-amylase